MLIFGHTHIPIAEKMGEIFVINPGSITFPKENNPNSCGILEENSFRIMDLDGNEFKKIDISM